LRKSHSRDSPRGCDATLAGMDLTGLLNKVLEPFATASFWAVALSISVLMTTLVKSIRKASPTYLAAHPWFGFIMTWTNVLLGVCSAIPAGVVPGTSFVNRLPFGLVAGGLSHYVYRLVLKRFSFFGGKPEAVAAPAIGAGPAAGGGDGAD